MLSSVVTLHLIYSTGMGIYFYMGARSDHRSESLTKKNSVIETLLNMYNLFSQMTDILYILIINLNTVS